MTTTMSSGQHNNDESEQGFVTVSTGAGRLLFALLLSTPSEPGELSMLANVVRKRMPALIDELTRVDIQYEVPDPVVPVGTRTEKIIPHTQANVQVQQKSQEEVVEEACITADAAGDLKEQALAVVEAWRLYFPNLANHKEVIRKQDLRPQKAREFINLVKAAFPGQEATTVFGWMGGVDEEKLLSMQFPLAWVEKMIIGRAAKAKESQKVEGTDVMGEWREHAQKIIDQGGNNHHGTQDSGGTLLRIAGRVKSRTEEPS